MKIRMKHRYLSCKISGLFLVFLLPLQFVLAQDVESIKSDARYLWGEGFGSTDDVAKQAALSDLTTRISVNVSGEFSIDDREVSMGGNIDTKSVVERIVRTYSGATLTNTDFIFVGREPEAHVVAYILRSEVEKVFKGREERIFSYMRYAENAEKEGRIDDAMRYYYWGFTLLKSLQNPNECHYKSHQTGEQELLIDWIPEQIRSICGKLKCNVAGVDGDVVNLLFTYSGQPVNKVDFRYMDGQNYSNIISAKEGAAEIELRPGVSLDRLQIQYEYEFRGQARQDRELEQVMAIFHGTPFSSATSTVTLGKKKEQKAASQQLQSAIATAGVATHATAVVSNETSVYETAVRQVVDAIRSRQYSTVSNLFTSEGYKMFDALIHNGSARVVGEPTFHFYQLHDRVICRSVPMSFSFKNNKRQFTEDVTFTFNAERQIESIAFGLEKAALESVFENDRAKWSNDVRMAIVTFLENYKTAFALKRLDYIRSIFSDDAIIIVGHVTKVAHKNSEQQRLAASEIVRYNRMDKNTYMKNLERCFASNDFINIRFSDSDIRQMGIAGLFGILIHQDYYSDNYGDTGFLFLRVDLDDPFAPVISVRTWQPERDPTAEGTLQDKSSPFYGLYHGGSF